MGVGEDFGAFCNNLAVTNRSSISDRYELITRRFNIEFWSVDSKVYHSIYAGSYQAVFHGATHDHDTTRLAPPGESEFALNRVKPLAHVLPVLPRPLPFDQAFDTSWACRSMISLQKSSP